MQRIVKIMPLLALIVANGCLFEKKIDPMKSVNNAQDIIDLFPTTAQGIKQLVSQTLATADHEICALINIPHEQRTFENTARAYDVINDRITRMDNILSVIMNTHPDATMRTAAQEGLIQSTNFSTDKITYNKPLFKAFEYYATHKAPQEQLNDEEKYFLQETMAKAKKDGLFLPDAEQTKIKDIVKQLKKLALDFENNINVSLKEILIPEAELAGLSPQELNAFKSQIINEVPYRIINIRYGLGSILDHCSVEATRKKAWIEYNNRAYPANEKVLHKIVYLRDQLARTLHYSDYAHYDIDLTMAKTPENVKKFLATIEPRAIKKAEQEFATFVKELPAGVTLTSDHKVKPWDFGYLKSWYDEKNYKLDSRYVAEFFPVESTLERVFKIYETLLGLTFEKMSVKGLWDKDVYAIAIKSTADNTLRGYLLLDLFPRPNKYAHAYFSTLTPSLKKVDGTLIPGLGIVIANFPKATATQPALLQHGNVVTFFHEFGHAIHGILGATELASFSGTNVKDDFVETPSQMFEEWMWDPGVIKSVSSHYKTGKPLPDTIISTMVKLKNFGSVEFVYHQLTVTNMLLDYFSGPDKNLQKVMLDYLRKFKPFEQLIPENHHYTAIVHLILSKYGAKYYNYLWSKFYALDLFETIKEQGLLNPEVGKRLLATILRFGGSKPPHDLLHNFLGREPRSDAFFKNYDLPKA